MNRTAAGSRHRGGLSWSFPDPAAFTGTREEQLARASEFRDAIRNRLEAWLADLPDHSPRSPDPEPEDDS